MDVRGHVRSSLESGEDDVAAYNVGVEFLGVDDELRRRLKEHVAEQAREAGAAERS